MKIRACLLMLSFAAALVGGALPGCSDGETPGETTPEPNGVLAPPASLEEGWQFTNEPFSVDAGQERQICYFVEVPYDTETFFNRINATHAAGSHHMNIFRVKTVKALGGKDGDIVEDGECWKSGNWSDWPLVINNQTESEATDWTLPEGVAHKFEAHELLMVQSHYVNATTQKTPGVGKVSVNFYRTPNEKVTAELGTVFATNQNIEICPGEVNKKFESTCKFAKDGPVTVIGANGHFHSRGLEFTMSTFDPANGSGSEFYDSSDWSHPDFDRNLKVSIPQGGGMKFSCSYAVPASECGDPSKECCFTFGGKVETQEHCNAFVYYYPKTSTDQNCFLERFSSPTATAFVLLHSLNVGIGRRRSRCLLVFVFVGAFAPRASVDGAPDARWCVFLGAFAPPVRLARSFRARSYLSNLRTAPRRLARRSLPL